MTNERINFLLNEINKIQERERVRTRYNCIAIAIGLMFVGLLYLAQYLL